MIQRLPGLGRANEEDGSRVLIDHDYAEIARSGDVYQFVCDPYGTELDCRDWQSALRDLGAEIVAYRCQLAGFGDGKLDAALRVAGEKQQGDTLSADILLSKLYLGGRSPAEHLFLREIILDSLPLGEYEADLSLIELQDSVISTISLGPEVSAKALPLFRRCHLGLVLGRTGPRDLPTGRFVDCTFGDFENAAQTTNAILNLPLPLSTKVLLTILKKLFAQAGMGRRESALVRGLDVRARELVPDLLDLLKRHGFVSRSRQGSVTVWLPARTSGIRRRALAMLGSPNASSDPLLEASKKI